MNDARTRTSGSLFLAFTLLALSFGAIALAVLLREILTTLLLTACAIGLITAGIRLLARTDRTR